MGVVEDFSWAYMFFFLDDCAVLDNLLVCLIYF